MNMPHLDAIKALLDEQSGLNFAVLVGNRATGRAHADSDWDVALMWSPGLTRLDRVARTETLRRALAKGLNEPESRIDLIDLASSQLAMRALVAEEGVPLSGEHALAWAGFLRRTWRELEDHCWERAHAA
jgi:predicted nucleotidyltransferase